MRDPDNSPIYGATGNGIAIMANRISYFLDVNGPSMTIDTGCSASLVCVHNACQSLRDGEIDVVRIPPDPLEVFAQLTPTGSRWRSRPDSDAQHHDAYDGSEFPQP